MVALPGKSSAGPSMHGLRVMGEVACSRSRSHIAEAKHRSGLEHSDRNSWFHKNRENPRHLATTTC
jgi:hypothetical protein